MSEPTRNDDQSTIAALRAEVTSFNAARDWRQFHDAKNLTMAIAIEAAELMEPLRWVSSQQLDEALARPDTKAALADEAADVLILLLDLTGVLGIDLTSAVLAKLDDNARRYPAAKFKGSGKKYNDI